MGDSPPLHSVPPGPLLGSGKYGLLQSELITADIEDEFDALNDETFGGNLQDNSTQDDWENSHDKLIQLDEELRQQYMPNLSTRNNSDISLSEINRNVSYETDYSHMLLEPHFMDSFSNPQETLEESLTKLVLDDDLDDPAIMNVSRTKSVTMPLAAAISRRSPPPPAIFESDNVGSPSTSSIWTPPHKLDNSLENTSFLSLFSSLKKAPSNYEALDDPSIVEAGKRIRGNSLPSEIIHRARTVDEIERDILNLNEISANNRLKETIERNVTQFCQVTLPDKQQVTNSISGILPVISPTAKNGSGEIGCTVSSSYNTHPTASPYSPSKLNLKSFIGQPYLNRMIPPQVGFSRLLAVQQPRAYLGHPIRFPGVMAPVNRPSVPGLIPFSQSRLCISPQPVYFDNRLNRGVPPPHLCNQNQQNLLRSYELNTHLMKKPDSQQSLPYSYINNEEDEYANLMTQKEKEWLIKIQMIQLQTNNPFLDDFYYTMYTMKKKVEEQNRGGGDHTQEPKLVVPETSKMETRTYQPAQYEGSLGKLQAVSVNFPRRIIDVETMHPEDAENEPFGNKELRKFRQLSLEIENLYSLFLTIDDLDKKMAALPKESCQQLEETKKNNIASIFNSLTTAITSEEKYVQIMNIKKGRNLVCRVFPLFALDEKLKLITAIIENWNAIMKKISVDEALHRFGAHFTNTIFGVKCMKKLMQIGKALQNNAIGIAIRTETICNKNFNLLPALLHKLGIKITCALLSHAEIVHQQYNNEEDKEVESEWSSFVAYVAEVWCSASGMLLIDSSFPFIYEQFQRFITDDNKLQVIKNQFQPVKIKSGSGDKMN